MKRTLLFILLFLLMLPVADAAVKCKIDGIYYSLTSSTKKAAVTYGQDKYSGDIVIPSTVTLDDVEYSVTEILGKSFANCPDLTSVTIPVSIASLGKSVFENSNNLTSIVIEEANPIYDSRQNCNAVIETASNKLLFGCKGTTIPNSVTTIGESAFYKCSGLTTISIPNSVTGIEKNAFKNCNSLSFITIGNGVATIGYDVFSNCENLVKVKLNNNAMVSKDYDPNDYYRLPSYFGGQVREYVLGEDVTRIGEYAFAGCGITTMNIPENVTSIGDNAFRDCWYLVEISISSGITDIEQWTFYMCQNLSKVVINSNALVSKDYGSRPSIFGFTCKEIKEVILGEDVKDIGPYVFCNLPKLSSVTISNSLTRMSANAFTGCPSLTDIYCYAEQVPAIYNYSVEEFDYTNATLHVPAGSLEAYRHAEIWKEFKEIVALSHHGEYRPFIEEGKVWKVGGTESGNPVLRIEYYYFDGDTIVEGKTCKQMMRRRYVSPEHPDYATYSQDPSLSYVGAWYEEDKKVYAYDSIDNQFKLMYDFSLDTNETLEINNLQYMIGPRQTGGIKGFKGFYRVIELEGSFYDTTWLEGVGSILGPTANVYYGKDGRWLTLMSCSVGDEVIYLNDEYEDGATPERMGAKKRRFDFTHTTKLQPKEPKRREDEQSIYGEFNDLELTVNLFPLEESYLVRITNETGKVVYEKAIDAGNIVALNVDISSYAIGRYTVTVENSQETFTGEFETQTTGIEEVRCKKSEVKGAIYNLQGQRLTSLQKGLNIVNGKKVYVR